MLKEKREGKDQKRGEGCNRVISDRWVLMRRMQEIELCASYGLEWPIPNSKEKGQKRKRRYLMIDV